MNYNKIPPTVRDAIDRHVRDGTETGHFVEACLMNDLVRAFRRGDPESLAALSEIARYIWWEIPEPSWGSREKGETWRRAREADRALALVSLGPEHPPLKAV